MLNMSLNQIVKNLNEEYSKLTEQIYKIKQLSLKKLQILWHEIKIGVIDELSLRYSKSETIKLLGNFRAKSRMLSDESISGIWNIAI